MLMDKAFTLDDIIAYQVKKQLGKMSVTGGGDDFLKSLGIRNIGDITKLIQQLSQLAQVTQTQRTMQNLHTLPPERNSATETTSSQATHTNIHIEPEMVYNGLVSVMEGLQTLLGDVKLSEAKTFLESQKEQVVALIKNQMAGMMANVSG